MNSEAIASKSGLVNSLRFQIREKMRRAEILAWYLCYRIITGPSKEHSGKSLDN